MLQLFVLATLAVAATSQRLFHNPQNGKTYLHDPSAPQKNITAARDFCQRNNGILVKVESKQESDWILQNIRPSYLHVGLQTTTRGQPRANFWMDGARVTWTNWERGQPWWNRGNPSNQQECWSTYMLGAQYANTNRWFAHGCGRPAQTLCELYPPSVLHNKVDQLIRRGSSFEQKLDDVIRNLNQWNKMSSELEIAKKQLAEKNEEVKELKSSLQQIQRVMQRVRV